MKILVVSNLYPPDVCGGYELCCQQAVDALRARGHEVLVLTTAPRRPVDAEPDVRRLLKLVDLWDAYTDERSTQSTLRLRDAEAFQISAFNVHLLTQVLEDFQPDVAYLWMLLGIGGLGLVGCLHHLGVPWVWHLMDDVPQRLCMTFFQVRSQLAREFSKQFRGSFLACSQHVLDDIARSGFALGDHVEVLPNWITGERFATGAPRTRKPDEPLRIMACGMVNRRKGIDVLIEAAARLRNAGSDAFQIDIYGTIEDSTLPALALKHGLTRQVVFKGPRPHHEVRRLYSDYDVFAFPTHEHEPFGIVPLEAMAAGCVPVITRRCGVAEFLVHGVHCIKATRTPKAFAEVFRMILGGEVDLGPLALRGRELVWRHYHLDAIIPNIERALQNASRHVPENPGTADEAYRLALLAEKLVRVFMQEEYLAGTPA